MYRFHPRLLALLLLGACNAPDPTEPAPFNLNVMTYNVLCSFCPGLGMDQHDSWAERAPMLRDLFAEYDLDLIGAQELTYSAPGPNNSDEVRDLAGETYEAIYYENPQLMDYPDATLLYRASRFAEHDRGFFWLSSTPDVPLSADFDPGGQFARVVAWAELEDLDSGEHFIFVTTHFDNNSPSQTLSAPLFLSRLQPLADRLPLVITGDFNSNLSTEAYGLLTGSDDPKLVNASDLLPGEPRAVGPEPDQASYNWDGRIDHIFLGGRATFAVSDWLVDLRRSGPNDRHLSDHHAMVSTMTVQPTAPEVLP